MSKINNAILYIPKKVAVYIGDKLLGLIAILSALAAVSYDGNVADKVFGGIWSVVKLILSIIKSYASNDLTNLINSYAGHAVISTVPNMARNLVGDTLETLVAVLIVYLVVRHLPKLVGKYSLKFLRRRGARKEVAYSMAHTLP